VLEREECLKLRRFFSDWNRPRTNIALFYWRSRVLFEIAVKSHLSQGTSGNKHYFCTKTENLTKAHIKYLEGSTALIYQKDWRASVMNSQGSGARTGLSQTEERHGRYFLKNAAGSGLFLVLMPFLDKSSSTAPDGPRKGNAEFANIKGLV